MYLERVNSPVELKKLNISELEIYAQEVRNFLIKSIKKTGGHLASNLGAVEFTIAMHYVFDCPNDKFLFDVGHQAYVHKIITGRRKNMNSLRQDGGLSGFPSPNESAADCFTTGHSSTSLSLALGMAKARDLSGQNFKILPVIGDGSFTGGMVYEALNDIGESGTNLIIVLNDNKMSISENISAISKYFTKLRLSKKYNKLKLNIKKTWSALPFTSKKRGGALNKVKIRIKEIFLANRLFENFGISYYGPVNGHSIKDLIDIFKRVSLKKRPSIIHLVTKKGKGLMEAEQSPDKFHGLSPFKEDREKSFSLIAGKTLTELADKDKKVVAVTAAMCLGTGLEQFAQRFPSRYFDVSIAEQHAVSLCAGLAKMNYKPFFVVYSTFLQRGFDQILHEISLDKLPVRFLIDRAGAVGSDGITHQGIFDISYLSMIPCMSILSPKDGKELEEMIKFSLGVNTPIAIRYPKSYKQDTGLFSPIEMGKWEVISCSKSSVYILAVGDRMLSLAKNIENTNIINARFISPLDTEYLHSINKPGNLIITLEDGVIQGGFGRKVLAHINDDGAKAKVINLGHSSHLVSRNVDASFIESGITTNVISNIITRFITQ